MEPWSDVDHVVADARLGEESGEAADFNA